MAIINNKDLFFKHILPQMHGEAMCFRDDIFYLVNPDSFAEVNRAQSVTRDVELLAHKYVYPTYSELVDNVFTEIIGKYPNLPAQKPHDVYWYFKNVPRASVFYVYFAILLFQIKPPAELANLLSLYPPSIYREIYPGEDERTKESLYAKFLALQGVEYSLTRCLRSVKKYNSFERSKQPVVQSYQEEFNEKLENTVFSLMQKTSGELPIETLCKVITTSYFLQLTIPLSIIVTNKVILHNIFLSEKLKDSIDPAMCFREFRYSHRKKLQSRNFGIYRMQLQKLFRDCCTSSTHDSTLFYSSKLISVFVKTFIKNVTQATKANIKRIFTDNPSMQVQAQKACKEMVTGIAGISVLEDFFVLYRDLFNTEWRLDSEEVVTKC